jgi:antibiotic biosynthesis monooxygenase
MIARVLRVAVDPEQVDAVVGVYRDIVRPIHARAAGLRHHYVLANWATGVIQIVGVWESADAVAAIAPELEPARARLWAQFGRDPELEIYEVADELSRV